jgi:Bacterial regulatory proteins, luxR family
VSARHRDDPLDVLSSRELEVLALMAEGRSNAGIARRLWVTDGADRRLTASSRGSRLVQDDRVAGVDSTPNQHLQVHPGAGQHSETRCFNAVFGRWCAKRVRGSG